MSRAKPTDEERREMSLAAGLVFIALLLAACGGGPKMCGPSQLDGDLLTPGATPDERQRLNRKLKEEFQQCLRDKCGEPPQGERRREWEKCSQYVSQFPLP